MCEAMTEMDFARYAGQLRPLTYRDMALLAELEHDLVAELDEAQAREGKPCDCYYCTHLANPREQDT
jgi:hypothetical protein